MPVANRRASGTVPPERRHTDVMKPLLAVLALFTCAVPLFAAVNGTVMNADGQPIAGAQVSLHAIETNDARRARLLSANPEANPLFSTQTDSKGKFTLDSPKDPLADLQIFLRGYEPLQRRIERDEDAGAIVLSRAEMKQGSVSASGKPVANATVVLQYTGTEYVTKSNAAGRYEAPDPRRARILTVIHPDFALHEETATGFREGISKLDRTLTAGAPLTGRVVREDGKTAVAKATVFVDAWPLATSGEDGTFSIPRAPVKWSSLVAQTPALVGVRASSAEKTPAIRVAKPATISGRVVDSKTKLPVAGAQVRLNSRGAGLRLDTWWSALSDAKGNYAISAAPGSYMVVAFHPAYGMRQADVNVAAGQSTNREIALSPLARVSGVVLNEEKKPVAAAMIVALDPGDEFGQRTASSTTAVSGPDGRFSYRVQSDVDLKLRATRKGLPTAMSETLKLAPGERRGNIVITIPSGVGVTGKVTDRDGNALSGVTVVASATPTGQRAMMQRIFVGAMSPGNDDDRIRTSSDGSFALRLTEGSYDFTFRREGFSTKNVRGKTISIGGTNVVETSLDPSVEITGRVVRSGSGLEGVNIATFGPEGESSGAVTGPDGTFTLTGLSPGMVRVMIRKEDELVNDQRQLSAPARDLVIEIPAGVRVTGRVVEKATHKPITSFQVGVSTSRSGGGMVMMMPPMLRSITSDDGSFTLDNVPVGAVNFVASAPGYSTGRLNLNIEEGKPVTNLEVELDTGVRLFGKITGPDGAGLSDATISLAMMGGPGMNVARATDKRTVTNSNGEYELQSLEPGEETIDIRHPKYLPERKTVQLKGREMQLDVQLSSGTSVSGVVVTESGAPVAEADVDAFAAGGTSRRDRTDASGRFDFDSLSPARYEFRASKSGYAGGTLRDVDITAGSPIRIVMKSGGTISGFVRGLNEQELGTTIVEAHGPEGTSTATVDTTGAYKLEGVPPGTVTVRATMTGRAFSSRKTSQAQTVEMSAGGSRQLDLEFRADTVIKGRVRRNGQPLGSAGVSFFPKPGSTQQTSATGATDEQGNYSISGLENGEYTVAVSDMQRFSGYTTTYEVRGAATFDIDYSASTLRGRAVEAGNGEPVSDARIQLRATGASTPMRFADRVTATDMNGTFNLDMVPPGNYTLTADKQGFGNQVRDLVVTDSPIDDLELRLPRNEGLSLTVVDARDQRSLSAQVVVFDMQGRVVQEQRYFMSTAGEPISLSLAAGSYVATIGAYGYGTRIVSVQSPGAQRIALGPAARIAVHSKHSDRLRVRLLDAGGRPYPRWSAAPMPMPLNASPGTTFIDEVAGGSYTLQLVGEGGVVMDSKPVNVNDGQTLDVEI